MDFPLDADVQCIDGHFGRSTTIIVDPTTEKVVYVAVKETSAPHKEYLVPVDMVGSTTPELIQLRCSRDDVVEMESFIETEYLEVWSPQYDDLGYGATIPQIVPVERTLVPAGTLAVRQGMSVEATDGYVGTVDELIVDSSSGRVTHLVLRKGHLWGNIDVALSVSQVERVGEFAVYLKLDRAGIEEMPMVQARRHYSKKEINAMDVELLVLTFDEVGKANKALQILKALEKEDEVEFCRNTAILVKGEDGKVALKEAEDVDAKQGALFGAITGGLLGLLAGPAGVILGAAAGAVTGRVAAARIDLGFSDEYLHKLQDELQAGSSALVTLVEGAAVEKVTEALADLNGRLTRQRLTGGIVSQFAGKANGD